MGTETAKRVVCQWQPKWAGSKSSQKTVNQQCQDNRGQGGRRQGMVSKGVGLFLTACCSVTQPSSLWLYVGCYNAESITTSDRVREPENVWQLVSKQGEDQHWHKHKTSISGWSGKPMSPNDALYYILNDISVETRFLLHWVLAMGSEISLRKNSRSHSQFYHLFQ
jgi:hypothetical protein